MRKILLATTAIAAMGVTAAHADISISGGMDFQYTTQDTAASADEASVDGNIKIKGSVVTDSGLSITVTQNNALQSATVEDAFMEVSGDFGKIILGQTDMVNDRNDGVLGINNDVFTLFGSSFKGNKIGTNTDDSTAANLGFESQSINGLKFYAGAVPDGMSQMGANFTLSGVNLMYQTTTGRVAGRDEQAMGAGIKIAGLGINMGKKQEDVSGTKTDSSDLALKYSVNDALTVSFLVEEGKTGAVKHDSQAVEVKYAIAPGLTAYVGTTSVDTAGVTKSGTAAALSVSF